jgi:hypothetical protein
MSKQPVTNSGTRDFLNALSTIFRNLLQIGNHFTKISDN